MEKKFPTANALASVTIVGESTRVHSNSSDFSPIAPANTINFQAICYKFLDHAHAGSANENGSETFFFLSHQHRPATRTRKCADSEDN